MNLLKLKKVQLVELCKENGINTKGTIPVLKEKLLKTGKYWELKYVKIKTKKERDLGVVAKQVSRLMFVSFDRWMCYVECCLNMSRYDLPNVPFRDYFDNGLTELAAVNIILNELRGTSS
jgi:hypothetical protein